MGGDLSLRLHALKVQRAQHRHRHRQQLYLLSGKRHTNALEFEVAASPRSGMCLQASVSWR
jgi:hypothetical protein